MGRRDYGLADGFIVAERVWGHLFALETRFECGVDLCQDIRVAKGGVTRFELVLDRGVCLDDGALVRGLAVSLEQWLEAAVDASFPVLSGDSSETRMHMLPGTMRHIR